MSKKNITKIAVAALLVSQLARAEEEGGLRVSISAGVEGINTNNTFIIPKTTVTSPALTFLSTTLNEQSKASFGAGAALTYSFGGGLAAGIKGAFDQVKRGDSVTTNNTLTSNLVSGLVVLEYDADFGKIVPYVRAGAGLSYTSVTGTLYDTTTPSQLTLSSFSAWPISAEAAIGIMFNVDPSVMVGLGGKLFYVQDITMSSLSNSNPSVTITGTAGSGTTTLTSFGTLSHLVFGGEVVATIKTGE
jgi:hypothetical protein